MGRLIRLPLELHWTHPLREFDLDDDSDRAFVYETVLQQGNLPAHIEAPWADYFDRVRGVKVERRWASARSKSA